MFRCHPNLHQRIWIDVDGHDHYVRLLLLCPVIRAAASGTVHCIKMERNVLELLRYLTMEYTKRRILDRLSFSESI